MATRKRVESWVVTDEFWRRVKPLIPVRQRSADKTYVRKADAGRPWQVAGAGQRTEKAAHLLLPIAAVIPLWPDDRLLSV